MRPTDGSAAAPSQRGKENDQAADVATCAGSGGPGRGSGGRVPPPSWLCPMPNQRAPQSPWRCAHGWEGLSPKGEGTTKRQMSQPVQTSAVQTGTRPRATIPVALRHNPSGGAPRPSNACHDPRGRVPGPSNARHGPRNCAPCRSNARHDPRGVAVQPTRAVSAISLQADPGYPRMRSSIWRGPPPYGARPAAADTGRPASRAVAPGLPGIPPCRRVSITNHGLLDIVDFWSAKTGKFPKKHVTAEAVPGL